MEELIDLIATDSSATDISDKIKEVLFAKAGERVENARPIVASSMFGDSEAGEEYNEDQE
jgi:hypothetical protein